MESQAERLQREMKNMLATCGMDSLNFVFIVADVKRLIGNSRMQGYLATSHPQVLESLQEVAKRN